VKFFGKAAMYGFTALGVLAFFGVYTFIAIDELWKHGFPAIKAGTAFSTIGAGAGLVLGGTALNNLESAISCRLHLKALREVGYRLAMLASVPQSPVAEKHELRARLSVIVERAEVLTDRTVVEPPSAIQSGGK
jgi:hypothetical protein